MAHGVSHLVLRGAVCPFVRLVMRNLLSLTWFCFVVSIVLGASVFMVGFVGAQTPEFDPNEGVDPDAAALDPFVVYEWAGSGSSCGVSGELIGAVGSAASDHGLVEGYSYSADGTLQPALYGATGDGSQENLATLIDTDLGAIDGDERWDRPVGPFQLLPISWTLYGGDANLDGVSDPQNLWDASAAAAEFLCAMGAGPSGNDFTAVRAYTGSERLSQRVLSRYEQILADSPIAQFVGGDTPSKPGAEEADPAQDDVGEVLLGDWDGDGIATEFAWEVSIPTASMPAQVSAIPLDQHGRTYGAQIRRQFSPNLEPLVGDWDRDGRDSIAIRRLLNADTDLVEFYDRFGDLDGNAVMIGSDEGVDAIWDQLAPVITTEPISAVPETSLTAANGQEIDLVRVEGILVNADISDAVGEMIAHARLDGIELTGWGWRSHERQIELRIQNCADPFTTPSSQCSPPTATPGHSRHEVGLAIDFHIDGSVITTGDPVFTWLEEHAATYGLFNLPSEPWHWSVDGR